MKLQKLILGISIILLAGLIGCANPFQENYESTLERWPGGEVSRLLPYNGDAVLVTSTDIKNDAIRMMENGYLLLGRSVFRSSQVNIEAARDVAHELGAGVVMVEKKYATTVTGTVPITDWMPDREVTLKKIQVIHGDVIETEVTKRVKGEFLTTYVPQTTNYYDYAATFWGKSIPPIFGVLVSALDDEAKKQIQSNKGVVIQAVIKNSPAYNADILRYDIITSFAGETVLDPDQFFNLVIKNKGHEVNVEINRDGETKIFDIQLKDE
jgi:hypothetical protein